MVLVVAEAGKGSTARPVVIDALVDPDVPPIPPHIELDQAKAMFNAVMKGDPHAGGVVKQSMKQGLKGLLPGR